LLDPFVGSGTTILAAQQQGVEAVGIEAHPFVSKIGRAKLNWSTDVGLFAQEAALVSKHAQENLPQIDIEGAPDLLHKCFTENNLRKLDALRHAIINQGSNLACVDLLSLALTGILRACSGVGTAQSIIRQQT